MSAQLALAVSIGFSREMQDAYDAGKLDAVIVRQEGSRRGGEKLTVDEFGWFATNGSRGIAARRCRWRHWRRPAACARSRCARSTKPASAGARGLSAAASPRWWRRRLAGLAVAPLARRIAPAGLIDIGPAHGCRGWRLEGDAAFEGQRSHQARGTADAGGDVPQRRGGLTAAGFTGPSRLRCEHPQACILHTGSQ